MSTPSKRGATGVAHPILDNILPELLQDLEGKITGIATVEQFVEHVFRIPPSTIQAIISRAWVLKEEPVTEYKECIKKKGHERGLYEPFRKMAIHLITDINQHLNSQQEKSIALWNGHGNQVIKTRYTTRKPDILSMWNSPSSTPVWAAVQAVFEFKRRQVRTVTKVTKEAAPGLASVSEVQPSSRSQVSASALEETPVLRRSGRIANASSSKRSKGASDVSISTSRSDTIPQTTIQSKVASSHHSSISAASSGRDSQSKGKRKHSGSHDEQPAKYDKRLFHLTQDQLQLATYALECLADSLRHYVTGIFIDTYDVSFWYYDRIGIIRTKRFDFVKHPENLALLLYALSKCNAEKAGFSPFLVSPSSAINPPSSLFNVDLAMPLPNSRNHVTRFTITAEEPLYRYRGLVGRGTMVYAVRFLPHDEPARENYVLKLSHPSTHRLLEADLIVDIRNCVPELRKFLPDIVFHATYTTAALDLPRARFLSLEAPIGSTIEERQLHAIAMPRYEALWDAKDLEEFKRIFIDLVECHYYAYENGRVLHRDLSENNLMFHRQGGKTYGLLADWDLASKLDDDGNVSVSNSQHRTGTIPFMSLDLLMDEPPPHLYRHDLESFFYILVWAAIHYDLGGEVGERKLPLNMALKKWDSGDFETVYNAKHTFLTSAPSAMKVYSQVRDEFKPLQETWLDPLWDLFSQALVPLPRSRTKQAAHGPDNRKDTLTFQAFMQVINHTPRSLFELAKR